MPRRAPTICATALLAAASAPACAQAVITWASDPVRSDETVLLRGGGFGTSPAVEIARLEDQDPALPERSVPAWTRLAVLQPADDALKFVLPADLPPGVVACRVVADGTASASVLLNRPEVWWMQGDAGREASAGGWLRLFGKCLGGAGASVAVALVGADGIPLALHPEAADGWSLRCALPAPTAPGSYRVRVHNGQGGGGAWSEAGQVTIRAPAPWPTTIFSVLAPYGPAAEGEMRRSLRKYGPPIDRSDGILAALAKAKAAGGGVVYFPAGRYRLKAPLELPPQTLLKGEGMGLVTLWWGSGHFNLDGGGDQGLAATTAAEIPGPLISGASFAIEDLSLYLPLAHRIGISGSGETRLRRVRVRVDHLWTQDGNRRPEGLIAHLGSIFEVSDCDIIAKGEGLRLGEVGVVARNRILAGKSPCPFGGVQGVAIEDNLFVSTFPTAYQNNPGTGRNIYYARNRHEAESAHQADFSCTFDRTDTAYQGTLAAVAGVRLTLAADPRFPAWASERHPLWRHAAVCVVSGRGSSQWRDVASFAGREWTIAAPFALPPDERSVVAIVPMCGRALMIGNRFEDANWVNAGFGTALDVIVAGNHLLRCAELLDYGMASPTYVCPNVNVQFFDNELGEGLTTIFIAGAPRPASSFAGQVTQDVIHRRERLTADNCGGIRLQGPGLREVIIEGCRADHPDSAITIEPGPSGVLVRHCRSATGALRLEGAVAVP